MTPISFRTVGFDLDGTLIDTLPDLAAALNHALAGLDLPPLPAEQVRPLIGGGARALLANAVAGRVPEAALDAAHARLVDHYETHLLDGSRPFPGAVEAVAALADAGVTLAVVTTKLERFARALLDASGLLTRFAAVVGGDTAGIARLKPAPDPLLAMVARCGGGRAAFVGDSRFDVAAARAAGMPAIACAWGYRDGPIGALGADAVIERFDQLLPALERLS